MPTTHRCTIGAIVITLGLAVGTLSSALAHEAHQGVCSETTLNALHADIQAMESGASKKAASDEMAMAQDMLAKNDLHTCAEHMEKAEEAMSQ